PSEYNSRPRRRGDRVGGSQRLPWADTVEKLFCRLDGASLIHASTRNAQPRFARAAKLIRIFRRAALGLTFSAVSVKSSRHAGTRQCPLWVILRRRGVVNRLSGLPPEADLPTR